MGQAASGRFDDPQQTFGGCYAADAMATALAETVIHEASSWQRDAWVVAEADLTSRWIVTFQRPARPVLRLADLTGTALKGLGLNNDLCASGDYTLPQQWAGPCARQAHKRYQRDLRYCTRSAISSALKPNAFFVLYVCTTWSSVAAVPLWK